MPLELTLTQHSLDDLRRHALIPPFQSPILVDLSQKADGPLFARSRNFGMCGKFFWVQVVLWQGMVGWTGDYG
jgi:hypothetical protein